MDFEEFAELNVVYPMVFYPAFKLQVSPHARARSHAPAQTRARTHTPPAWHLQPHQCRTASLTSAAPPPLSSLSFLLLLTAPQLSCFLLDFNVTPFLPAGPAAGQNPWREHLAGPGRAVDQARAGARVRVRVSTEVRNSSSLLPPPPYIYIVFLIWSRLLVCLGPNTSRWALS